MLTAGLIAALLLPIGADLPVEAPLVPGAVPLEEPGRYRSTRGYEDTLEFYKRLFRRTGGVRWHNIVNLPGIKAKNIESLRRKTRWEGINVYEHRGEVRIFVIPREHVPTKGGGRKHRGKH